MERIYNSELQARVEAYIASGRSQEETSKLIGVTGGLLSAYRKSNYNGNIENVENKLSEFFKLNDAGQAQAKRAEAYRPIKDYIPTDISENVYKTIEYCQLEKGMVIIHGDAGVGKTRGAEKYVLSNPASTIYIQVSPIFGSLGSILKLLARELKIVETKSKFDLVLQIRQKLEGSNKVVIIDEAQHLKLAALEELRKLADPDMIKGKQGIGIVLIGNSEVYDRMLGKQEPNFAQLFSRILFHKEFLTINITLHDVEKLFPLLYEKKMSKELEFLHSVCKSKWGIRGAVNVYNNAVNSEDISYKGLLTMARTMGIGLL